MQVMSYNGVHVYTDLSTTEIVDDWGSTGAGSSNEERGGPGVASFVGSVEDPYLETRVHYDYSKERLLQYRYITEDGEQCIQLLRPYVSSKRRVQQQQQRWEVVSRHIRSARQKAASKQGKFPLARAPPDLVSVHIVSIQ